MRASAPTLLPSSSDTSVHPLAARLRRLATCLALALLGLGASAEPARAQPAEQRAPAEQARLEELARSLLTSREEERYAVLAAELRALEPARRVPVLNWLERYVSDPRAGRLVSTLAQLEEPQAARLLAGIASRSADERYPGSPREAALLALARRPLRVSLPLLARTALTASDGDVRAAHAQLLLDLVKEGPEQEEVAPQARRALLLRAAAELLRREPSAAEPWTNLCATWIAETNELDATLRELLRDRLAPQTLGLLRGLETRLNATARALELPRTAEAQRRARLRPSEAEALPELEVWYERELSRSPHLRALEARLQSEREALRSTLRSLSNRTDEPLLLRTALEALERLGAPSDPAWLELEVTLLEFPDAGVRGVAFRLLKAGTGQTLPQTPAAWRAYLARAATAGAPQ